MKMRIAVIATMLTALPTLLANAHAQTPPKDSTLTIAGHTGEAQLLQVNGKSYIDIETLTLLTQGTLTFKPNQAILTLPPTEPEVQTTAPHARAGFSRAFTQAGIEEMSVIREWRVAIVNAIGSNIPVSEEWIATQHRLADKDLALASAATSTDDDRSANPLLSAEFNNMQHLSELYIAVRKQGTFISPDADAFNNGPLEDHILSCARDFVSMTESHEFQDLSACH